MTAAPIRSELANDAQRGSHCGCSAGLEPSTQITQKENHNELHLFAGAGGGILGGILLGHTTVCAVEIEPHNRKILLARQRDGILPHFPIWDDVRTFDGKPWAGKVQTICGGFPCQDISQANPNAKGLEGERSGLWAEMRRIIGDVQPSFVVVENSPMLVVRGLARVIGDLAGMGYDSKWGVLRGDHAGVPQRRARLWIVASATRRSPERIHNQNAVNAPCDRTRLDARGGNNADAHNQNPRTRPVPILANSYWREVFDGRGSRGIDGLADRVGREKATGNGQIPVVAALAWRLFADEQLEASIRCCNS